MSSAGGRELQRWQAGKSQQIAIGFKTVDVELDWRQRLEGEFGVSKHNFDHALHKIGLDRGVGPASTRIVLCPLRPPSNTSMIE